MNLNKITLIITISVSILLIAVPTVYKVVKNHQDSLYEVVNKKICEAAKKCYYEDKCKNEETSLKELYDLEYLEKMSDPITKEYYNENSYVKRDGNAFEFVPVE